MKEFNINDYVNIKLTETGIAILKNRHDNILKNYANNPEVLKILGEFNAPIDDNGYTQMQLWEVMHIFGDYLYHGNPNLPFEMNITISDEYLKDKERSKI